MSGGERSHADADPYAGPVTPLANQYRMRNAWLAYIAGPVAFTGVQLIAPTLPLMATDFDLSNTQLALVTSVYLLPAAVFALPAGFLADRWGRRLVMGWSLVLFGACGGAYLMVNGSFPLFLSFRFVQGVAFAAILPLTITILGDSFGGTALVRAQGFRSLSLGLGEAVLPILGGFLAAVSWQAAWAVQLAAIPVGILTLGVMTDVPRTSVRGVVARGRDLGRLILEKPVAALEWVGVQRMFVKFSLLAFLPVYLIDVRGQSTEFVGLVLGLAAAVGVLMALMAARLTRKRSVTTWVGVGMFLVGAAVLGFVLAPVGWLILVSALLYGAADGVTGVLSNSLVAVASDGELRASFVAATGAIRNFAKFLAPAAFGVMALTMPLGASFIALGVFGSVSAISARFLTPLEMRLRDQEAS